MECAGGGEGKREEAPLCDFAFRLARTTVMDNPSLSSNRALIALARWLIN